MARFSTKDIFFKDGDMAVFGSNKDSKFFWNGTADEMCVTTTISGVNPTQDYHLTTKQYVDTISGSITGSKNYSINERFSVGDLLLDSNNFPSNTVLGPLGALLFSPTTDESTYGSFIVPQEYKSNTNITLKIRYMNAAAQAGTNNCVWAVDYHSYVDGETYASKTTTTVSVTDALPNNAAAGMFQETEMTLSYNDANNPIVAGDTITFRFYRDANNGSDTMTGNAAFFVLIFNIETEVEM